MSYSKLFEQNRVRIHRKAVSTKILDSIHRLMMEVNENSPRRWVWELIQNAGDAAQGEEVEIFIHLKRDGEGWRLEFSHSGRPFNVLTLTSLVNQVSGKERGPREEGRESTGRFGTGFMTTHLLSRKVEVRSVIQEEGEDCKRFRILLDRSGTTLREIEEGLDQWRPHPALEPGFDAAVAPFEEQAQRQREQAAGEDDKVENAHKQV